MSNENKEFHQPDDVKKKCLGKTHVHVVMVPELPEMMLFLITTINCLFSIWCFSGSITGSFTTVCIAI